MGNFRELNKIEVAEMLVECQKNKKDLFLYVKEYRSFKEKIIVGIDFDKTIRRPFMLEYGFRCENVYIKKNGEEL